MNHKEAIQRMLDGETMEWVYGSSTERHQNNTVSYDPISYKFHDDRNMLVDINRFDFSKNWRIKPKRWRAVKGQTYWYINSYADVDNYVEDNMELDLSLWELGNYFKTEDEAEEAAETIRKFWEEYRDES